MKSNSLERNQKLRTAGTYLFFIIGSIIMIFPFVWMFLTSFKTVAESMQIPPDIFPAQWIVDNFKDAMASLPFGALYKNTILLIFWRVVCAVGFSSMACTDDASFPDFHYTPVPDAGEDGPDQHDFRTGIPRLGECIRNLFPAPGIHGDPG